MSPAGRDVHCREVLVGAGDVLQFGKSDLDRSARDFDARYYTPSSPRWLTMLFLVNEGIIITRCIFSKMA
ncbi:MAG: hypothetical protein IJ654_01350 [Bacteroidales bacterium]|nr:hypothetical protein [Bacteroidales bacterium]